MAYLKIEHVDKVFERNGVKSEVLQDRSRSKSNRAR